MIVEAILSSITALATMYVIEKIKINICKTSNLVTYLLDKPKLNLEHVASEQNVN
jgi:hypothetical protein